MTHALVSTSLAVLKMRHESHLLSRKASRIAAESVADEVSFPDHANPATTSAPTNSP